MKHIPYLYVYKIYASPYIVYSNLNPFPFSFTSPPYSLNCLSGETRGVRREFVRLRQARVVFPFPLFEDRPLIDTRAKRRLSEHLFRHRWESKEGPRLVPRAYSNAKINKQKKKQRVHANTCRHTCIIESHPGRHLQERCSDIWMCEENDNSDDGDMHTHTHTHTITFSLGIQGRKTEMLARGGSMGL